MRLEKGEMALLFVTVLVGCSAVHAQTGVTFSRVTMEPHQDKRLDYVLAVADINGDGRADVVAGGREEYTFDGTREDRFTKTELHVFVGEEDGSLTYAPELVDGPMEARNPFVVTSDFNGDDIPDLAIFDRGVYVGEESLGYGNPPQLFVSCDDGVLRPTSALEDAVRREHELFPHPRYSGADLHIKVATSGDIDGDGDIDLWVESTGGANVNSHFMVNNGDGTFTIEMARATDQVLRNDPPDYWRHVGSHLVDVDNDGDLDLALGQIRDADPGHINQSSIVVVNDGTGYYRTRIELPHPAFNDGFTAVNGITDFDVNEDGFQDLLLEHHRNDDTPLSSIPFTGRYIQVLLNRDGGTSFGDETSTWIIGDQSATTPEYDPDGDELHNWGFPKMHDVDRDGCADLVMSENQEETATHAPLVYRNNGSGQFEAMPPEPFTGGEQYFGLYAVPADVNGDDVIDFVVPEHYNGPDDQRRTDDDYGALMTLVNTTPAGPARCQYE